MINRPHQIRNLKFHSFEDAKKQGVFFCPVMVRVIRLCSAPDKNSFQVCKQWTLVIPLN